MLEIGSMVLTLVCIGAPLLLTFAVALVIRGKR